MKFCITLSVACLAITACNHIEVEPFATQKAALEEQSESPNPASELLPVVPRDAGDQAWVKRVIPLLWGRQASSINEIHVLTEMTEQLGRDKVVRAMAKAPDYFTRWELFFKDALDVARLGFSSNPGCYGRSLRPEITVDVAQHVIENKPDGSPLSPSFTMRDLIHSALLLDDISPIYLANLPANLYRHLDDMHVLAAIAQRRSRAQSFVYHYLNRRMTCLACHNSEQSLTGHPDPEYDRTWEIPGHYEKALFGLSHTANIMQLIRYFRRKGVRGGYYYTHDNAGEDLKRSERFKSIRPWGWDESCGHLLPPGEVLEDDVLEWESFFVEASGSNASIWDLEAHMRGGLEKLRKDGVNLNGLEVDGEEAFAFLWTLNVADRVWRTAFGRRLTIALFFARNQLQRDTLQSIAQVFTENGFSLVELLVAITTHPYFNGATPESEAETESYGAIFDPFVQEERTPSARRNKIGDIIFRDDARVILRRLYRAMEWEEPPEYLFYFLSESARLQRNLGVFLKNGDAGFKGTSFQSSLSWESYFGMCRDRSTDPTCPLQLILDSPVDQGVEATICEICTNKDLACNWDARCCDISWESYCSEECDTGDPNTINLAIFPQVLSQEGPDFITQVVEQAQADKEYTLRNALAALKDRLISVPHIDSGEEAQWLEALFETSLETVAADDTALEEHLRRACGVFASSPQFLLTGFPSQDIAEGHGGLIPPGQSFRDLCEQTALTLFGDGMVQCGEHSLKIVAP